MNNPLIECVPNFAEGRNSATIEAFLAVLGTVPDLKVLHVTSDADHNRTVITFAGFRDAVLEAAVLLTQAARDRIDLRHQSGVHPRLGALDVLPFIPLAGATLQDCIELSHQAGHRIWNEVQIPVYFYESAALRPERRKLEDVRRGQFEGLAITAPTQEDKAPDVGGPALHPSAGAVIVGARKFLIAYNINLQTGDLEVAKTIARTIRTSSGGLPHVKALGLPLASRGLVQVSMNLTDFETTSIAQVFANVSRLALDHRVEVEESELIGLAPQAALNDEIAAIVKLKDFGPGRIIENLLSSTGSPQI